MSVTVVLDRWSSGLLRPHQWDGTILQLLWGKRLGDATCGADPFLIDTFFGRRVAWIYLRNLLILYSHTVCWSKRVVRMSDFSVEKKFLKRETRQFFVVFLLTWWCFSFPAKEFESPKIMDFNWRYGKVATYYHFPPALAMSPHISYQSIQKLLFFSESLSFGDNLCRWIRTSKFTLCKSKLPTSWSCHHSWHVVWKTPNSLTTSWSDLTSKMVVDLTAIPKKKGVYIYIYMYIIYMFVQLHYYIVQ